MLRRRRTVEGDELEEEGGGVEPLLEPPGDVSHPPPTPQGLILRSALEAHGIRSETRPARHTAPKRGFGTLPSRETALTSVIVTATPRSCNETPRFTARLLQAALLSPPCAGAGLGGLRRPSISRSL